MAGIPTSNILQPGNISITGGVTRALISQLQILKPALYPKYTEKYGNEDFTWWLMTYAGMEKAINQTYTWAENRGKLMEGVTNNGTVAAAAGATVTLTLALGDHFNSGTQSPLRVGETLRVASSDIEGVILTIDTTTPNAFTFTVRPKKSTQGFTSAGSTSLLAGEILKFAGDVDAGEASNSIEPLIHLDQLYSNSITEMRESWSATDLAEMAEVFYDSGVSGTEPSGGQQAGYSYFTYKGLVKSNTRYKNNVEFKLMFGDTQNNTGLTNSIGSQGVFPKIRQDGETVGIGATIDIQKLHEITRVMDVNGCAKQAMWLQDIFLRQGFSDGIFKEFPAGAWVWGKNENSEEAAIAYGVQSMKIDEYMFMAKKYPQFNTEYTTGKTPTNDFHRNSGYILPMGNSVPDAKDASKTYKNVTVMYQDPPAGGTVGNGIRVWQHGGGSRNPTNGQMKDNVEQICYRGTRICGANQFIFTPGQ